MNRFVFDLGSETKKSSLYSIEGFLFGFLSLICDACVSHFQLNLKKKNIKLSYLELTFAINLFMLITNIVLSLVTGELVSSC